MKLLNEHKGIIIFYILLVAFALWFSGQVEKQNDRMTSAKNAQVENWSGTNENN